MVSLFVSIFSPTKLVAEVVLWASVVETLAIVDQVLSLSLPFVFSAAVICLRDQFQFSSVTGPEVVVALAFAAVVH